MRKYCKKLFKRLWLMSNKEFTKQCLLFQGGNMNEDDKEVYLKVQIFDSSKRCTCNFCISP
ncbi:hypothetical protein JCM16816_10770 [Thermoanaerobacter brockii subsp. lactiethylicus]